MHGRKNVKLYSATSAVRMQSSAGCSELVCYCGVAVVRGVMTYKYFVSCYCHQKDQLKSVI